jgi:hypothetical protein
MSECQSCGEPLDVGSTFCHLCGKALQSETQVSRERALTAMACVVLFCYASVAVFLVIVHLALDIRRNGLVLLLVMLEMLAISFGFYGGVQLLLMRQYGPARMGAVLMFGSSFIESFGKNTDEFGVPLVIISLLVLYALKESRHQFTSEGGRGWDPPRSVSMSTPPVPFDGKVTDGYKVLEADELEAATPPEYARSSPKGPMGVRIVAGAVMLTFVAFFYTMWTVAILWPYVGWPPAERVAYGLIMIIVTIMVLIGAYAAFMRVELKYALAATVMSVFAMALGYAVTSFNPYFLAIVGLPFSVLSLVAMGLFLSARSEFERGVMD